MDLEDLDAVPEQEKQVQNPARVRGWRNTTVPKSKPSGAGGSSKSKAKAAAKKKKQDTATAATATGRKKEKGSRVEELDGDDSDDNRSDDHSDESTAGEADTESHKDQKPEVDEDAEWERLQRGLTKKEKVLEGRSRTSHPVYAPYFTEDKQEYWWTYVCERRQNKLITSPFLVTNLVSHQEVQLKFTAPMKPGNYSYQVCLMSDSYLGFDKRQDIKLDVKEAREIPTEHPQWDECSSEEENDEEEGRSDANDGEESEFTTDEESGDEE